MTQGWRIGNASTASQIGNFVNDLLICEILTMTPSGHLEQFDVEIAS